MSGAPYTLTDLYKDQEKYLASQINTKNRLTELNDGYRKRYAKYVEILAVITVAILIHLGVRMLQQAVPVISNTVVDTLSVLLIVAVAIYTAMAISELMSRSRIDYDELDIVPVVDLSGATAPQGETGQLMPAQCTTADCCAGLGPDYKWDATTGRCSRCQGAECCGNGTHWGGATKCFPDAGGLCDTGFYWGGASTCKPMVLTGTPVCDTGKTWNGSACA